MSTQLFMQYRDSIISNHSHNLQELEVKYSQYIQQLLNQKTIIIQHLENEFKKRLKHINQLIDNSIRQQLENNHNQQTMQNNNNDNNNNNINNHHQYINDQDILNHDNIDSNNNINDDIVIKHEQQQQALNLNISNTENRNNTDINHQIFDHDAILIKQEKRDINILDDKQDEFDINSFQMIYNRECNNNINDDNNDKNKYNKDKNNNNNYNKMKCSQCPYIAHSQQRMDIHSRIHLTEKPFECEICNKQYTTKGALTVHLRIHRGPLPFKCKICHKLFNQIPHLRYHLLGHTNERPWKCTNSHCNQAFKTKKLLQNHMKNTLHSNSIKQEPLIANKILEESLIESRGYGISKNQSKFTQFTQNNHDQSKFTQITQNDQAEPPELSKLK